MMGYIYTCQKKGENSGDSLYGRRNLSKFPCVLHNDYHDVILFIFLLTSRMQFAHP
jgi:hypothetical protein